ncbi:hypothetical protein J4Q44_G00057620, partial [Coregonus suidteri]
PRIGLQIHPNNIRTTLGKYSEQLLIPNTFRTILNNSEHISNHSEQFRTHFEPF